jgi:hypothetical protein
MSGFAMIQVGATTLPSHMLTGWPVAFHSSFRLPPVVLTHLQEAVVPSVSMAARVSTANFYAIADGQASSSVRAGHRLGWLALDAGQGLLGGLYFEASRQIVSTSELSFGNGFSGAPLLFANAQTGSDDHRSPVCVLGNSESAVMTLAACAPRDPPNLDASSDTSSALSEEVDVSFLSLSGSGDIFMVSGQASR